MTKSKKNDLTLKNWYDVIPKKFITKTHNPHYNKANANFNNERPFFCKEYVAGYTVPTPEDYKFFPIDKPGC